MPGGLRLWIGAEPGATAASVVGVPSETTYGRSRWGWLGRLLLVEARGSFAATGRVASVKHAGRRANERHADARCRVPN